MKDDRDELERLRADLAARERELERREQAVAVRGLKRNYYENIGVSRRAMDVVVLVLALVIVALIAIGAYLGKGSDSEGLRREASAPYGEGE